MLFTRAATPGFARTFLPSILFLARPRPVTFRTLGHRRPVPAVGGSLPDRPASPDVHRLSAALISCVVIRAVVQEFCCPIRRRQRRGRAAATLVPLTTTDACFNKASIGMQAAIGAAEILQVQEFMGGDADGEDDSQRRG